WRLRLLTLGSWSREVVVDPKQGHVTIHRRYLWFFRRRRRVRVGQIPAGGYGYPDPVAGGPPLSVAHDRPAPFSTGLRLSDGEELHLFHFFGDGTFANHGPWPDWLYWEEYLFDVTGTQERESKGFVELLARMVGVPVEPARS